MSKTPAVAGYRPLTPEMIVQVNENKILEELVLRQIDRHVRQHGSAEIDQRAVALARTHVQDAFMWLNRAVFQPQRLLSDQTPGFAHDAERLTALLSQS